MKFKNIFTNKKTIIVAEIGNNHEGDFSKAIKLIDAAKTAGADAVKFQTYKTENYYNIKYTEKKRIKRLRKFQLSFDQFKNLSDYSKKKKIEFYSTPFDYESAIFLNNIQSVFKISSGDNNFFSLIRLVKSFKKPIVLSTGLINFNEIKNICKEFTDYKYKNKLGLLHCVSKYPAKEKDLNLASITYLKNKLPYFEIGYSDHSLNTDSCKLAISLGSFMIEKHFTLDKNTSNFHDHKISATPNELEDLVRFAKNIKLMIGKYKKIPKEEEVKNSKYLRRSAYFTKNLKKGTILSSRHFIFLRPRKNLFIKNENQIIGKIIKKNVIKNDLITKKILI